MGSATGSAGDVLIHEVSFSDEETYLKEYESNIKHGGMFLPWNDPPPKDTPLKIRVRPPCDLEPVELDAIVVFPTPAGVGVELRNVDGNLRARLDTYAGKCRSTIEQKKAAQETRPSPVPVPPPTQSDSQGTPEAQAPTIPVPPPPQSDSQGTPEAATSVPPGTEQVGTPPSAGAAQAVAGPAPQARPARPRRPDTSTPSWEGSLSDQAAADVFVTLGNRNATGMLVIKSDVAESKYYYRNGSIVRFVRQPPDEKQRFGQILLESAKISTMELEGALEEARAKGLPIGQALVRRRALPASGVGKILRQQMKTAILEQAEQVEGTFAFYERVRPPRGQPMPPANPRRVIFRGKVDKYKARLQPEMDKIEKPDQFQYVYPTEAAPDDMSLIGLNDQEIRFWTLCITGGYMLKDVFSVSPLNRRTTHGLIYALMDLGMVEFKPEMAPELRAKLMKKLLRRKQADLNKANHFQVLEIHWISTEQEVKEAYAKVRKEYDCSKIAHLLSPELLDLSKEILERIDLAYKELSTHNGRQLCRQASLEPAQIAFHVDLLMQQGDMAIFKGDRREAVDRFTHVLEIAPGNRDAKHKLQTIQATPIT